MTLESKDKSYDSTRGILGKSFKVPLIRDEMASSTSKVRPLAVAEVIKPPQSVNRDKDSIISNGMISIPIFNDKETAPKSTKITLDLKN